MRSEKDNKRDVRREKPKKEFEELLLEVRRVTRVTTGGRRLSFRATILVGNKKGKILFAFSNILVAFVIIIALALTFEKDWKVEISDTVKISTILYKDNIKQSDIENLELLDKFPNKRAVRMNGGATKEKAYGNFSIEGEGNVRLYVFKKTDKVIKISRKNQKTVYINMRTNKETEELYEKLKNFVDK